MTVAPSTPKAVVEDGGDGKTAPKRRRPLRRPRRPPQPADRRTRPTAEPAFSPDGRTIVFARGGDLYSVRADGSGQRALTSGAELDSAPLVSPNGRYVVFERRATEGAPRRPLHGRHRRRRPARADQRRRRRPRSLLLARRPRDRLRPQRRRGGRRHGRRPLLGAADRGGLARLTRTGAIDEFEPRYFAGGIVFSRGESGDGPERLRRRLHDAPQRHQGASRWSPASARPTSKTSRRTAHAALPPRPGPLGEADRPGRARKLSELPDGSQTNAVFSSDGRRVAAFVAADEAESLPRSTSHRPRAPSSPKASAWPKRRRWRRRSARSSPGSRPAARPQAGRPAPDGCRVAPDRPASIRRSRGVADVLPAEARSPRSSRSHPCLAVSGALDGSTSRYETVSWSLVEHAEEVSASTARGADSARVAGGRRAGARHGRDLRAHRRVAPGWRPLPGRGRGRRPRGGGRARRGSSADRARFFPSALHFRQSRWGRSPGSASSTGRRRLRDQVGARLLALPRHHRGAGPRHPAGAAEAYWTRSTLS